MFPKLYIGLLIWTIIQTYNRNYIFETIQIVSRPFFGYMKKRTAPIYRVRGPANKIMFCRLFECQRLLVLPMLFMTGVRAQNCVVVVFVRFGRLLFCCLCCWGKAYFWKRTSRNGVWMCHPWLIKHGKAWPSAMHSQFESWPDWVNKYSSHVIWRADIIVICNIHIIIWLFNILYLYIYIYIYLYVYMGTPESLTPMLWGHYDIH